MLPNCRCACNKSSSHKSSPDRQTWHMVKTIRNSFKASELCKLKKITFTHSTHHEALPMLLIFQKLLSSRKPIGRKLTFLKPIFQKIPILGMLGNACTKTFAQIGYLWNSSHQYETQCSEPPNLLSRLWGYFKSNHFSPSSSHWEYFLREFLGHREEVLSVLVIRFHMSI